MVKYMTAKPQKAGLYGIRIKDYCAGHETYVLNRLEANDALDALLLLHERKLNWLQHERLVHLIVLSVIAVLFLFTVWLFIALANPFVLILIGIVLILLLAYIRHYFFLENTVQRWYTLYDRISEKAGQ